MPAKGASGTPRTVSEFLTAAHNADVAVALTNNLYAKGTPVRWYCRMTPRDGSWQVEGFGPNPLRAMRDAWLASREHRKGGAS